GFYMALGERDLGDGPDRAVVRLYWHLKAEAAPGFVAKASTALNAAGIPFRLKVVNDPNRYTRCDAGVLYVARGDYEKLRPIAQRLYGDIVAGLRQATPAFTKTLAPGLGLAEDPGSGASFGMSRCHIVAEALVRARERGTKDVAGRLATIEECF